MEIFIISILILKIKKKENSKRLQNIKTKLLNEISTLKKLKKNDFKNTSISNSEFDILKIKEEFNKISSIPSKV